MARSSRVNPTGRNKEETAPGSALIYAAGSVLSWSTVATAFKLTLRSVSPLQLVFGASLVSLLMLVVLLFARGGFFSLFSGSLSEYGKSAFLGLINPFLYYLVLFGAYSRLLGQEALVLNYSWPIFLTLLSIPLLGKKIRWQSLAALLVSFTGVILILSRGKLKSFSFSDPLGITLALVSALIWATYWLLNMQDKREILPKLGLNFFFGFLYALIAVALRSSFPRPPLQATLGIAYVGVLEMALPFVLWLTALERSPSPALLGNLVYLSPFLSLLLLHLVLGEPLLVSTFLGLSLIVSGIVLQKWSL